ncbi:unnamed protein product [Rotaria sp. Silwood2]|nr:unnamed protein product [Rotaria sp. Silwood2]CAF4366522.1 unnamed protein product [Rotaria sp. Silwood2]
MCDQYRKSYRLGRRPGEQGPRPLSRNQDRVEKLATGTATTTTTKTKPTTDSSTANATTTNSSTANPSITILTTNPTTANSRKTNSTTVNPATVKAKDSSTTTKTITDPGRAKTRKPNQTTTNLTTANSATANSATTNSTTTNSVIVKTRDSVTTNTTGTSTRPARITNKSTITITKVPKCKTQKLKITKNTLTVGTWNVRTLWAAGKLDLLRHEMNRYRYDIIGISEVRWTGKREIPRGDFIWSGENSNHIRGVGILLSTKAKKSLMSYNPINSRIIMARFNATPFNVTIIHAYAPTSDSSEDDIETFYNCVEEAIEKVPKKDVIIITGDWNAKVGTDNTGWESVMGRYGYGSRNERGERLLEFAAEHNLFICNTRFQQTSNRKWTWESPDGIHKNMIDLVIVQKRWKTSVTNCRTFQGADISSDHSLVLCNIKLKLKNKPRHNQRYDVSQLKDQTTRQSYQARIEDNLKNIHSTCNLNEHAAQIEKAVKEALQATVTLEKTSKKSWIFDQTLDLTDKKRKAKQIKHLSADSIKEYKNLCNKVKNRHDRTKKSGYKINVKKLKKDYKLATAEKRTVW